MKKRELLERIEALENAVFVPVDPEEKQQYAPEIIPAECLREMPKKGDSYWLAVRGRAENSTFITEEIFTILYFQAGLMFPYTPEGKAGAELRAKQGIVPYPVAPAKALTEAPEVGKLYWFTDNYGQVCTDEWTDEALDMMRLAQGPVFSYDLRGKLGAAMFQEGGQDE